MANFIKGPSLAEIITKNWTLDEFISEGYLTGGEVRLGNRNTRLPQLILRGDNPDILKIWARQISPAVEKLYQRLGWNIFVADLLFVHNNPGKLFYVDNRYSTWFRQGNSYVDQRSTPVPKAQYVVIVAGPRLTTGNFTLFEDVFYNIISLAGNELISVNLSPIKPDFQQPLITLYNQEGQNFNRVLGQVENGQIIRITGFPNQLSVAPLVEMSDGYFFINDKYEFVLIGRILTQDGYQSIGKIYGYQDGQLMLASIVINHQWTYADF